MNTAYLIHHGIKGQKWGIRRYQNPDGSLTPAGLKRYGSGVKNAQEQYTKIAKANMAKARRGDVIAKAKIGYADDKVAKEKLKVLAKEQEEKESKRYNSLKEQYKKEGMSDEDAAINAVKRQRAEKIIACTAGLTVGAIAAYGAYKYYDNNVERIIKSGTKVQNISIFEDKGVSDAFYASTDKSDNTKYLGLYTKQLKNTYGGNVYKTTMQFEKDVKMASRKTSKEALQGLLNSDQDFRDNVCKIIGKYGPMMNVGQKVNTQRALKKIAAGKVDDGVYDMFNAALTVRDTEMISARYKFYKNLQSKGYDAIIDVNDKRYSGYGAKKPMIIFGGIGGGDGKISVVDRQVISDEEQKRAYAKAAPGVYANIYGKQLASAAGAAVGIKAATKAAQRASLRSQKNAAYKQAVAQYRKEHPNSKLSDEEILENYLNEDQKK